MTPVDARSYHLKELGVTVRLTPDAHNLELDALKGVLTPELVGLVREHKGALVESVYLSEEAEAIAWEGCLSDLPLPSHEPVTADTLPLIQCFDDSDEWHIPAWIPQKQYEVMWDRWKAREAA